MPHIECPYPLRNELRFKSRNIRTVRYGIETATFVGFRIWSCVLSKLKDSASLNKFSSKNKNLETRKLPVNFVKSTFRESFIFKLLIIICSQILFPMFLICLCVLLLVFFCLFLFLFHFLLFLTFSFKSQFKVDANQHHIPDKDYICSLTYFGFVCNFY